MIYVTKNDKMKKILSREATLTLPDDIRGDYNGKRVHIKNIANTNLTEVFVDGKRLGGSIRRIVVFIEANKPTRLHLEMTDFPPEKPENNPD